ncbi:MAG: DUF3108 domain-containing protein [Myxococcaceae bacterium]|nr:DUF3108 domain-containing protein [Myxococcaceae bacterium]
MRRRTLLALVLLFALAAPAQTLPKQPAQDPARAAAIGRGAPMALPTNAACASLGAPQKPYAFATGEVLEYELDAMGATAGTLKLRVLPKRAGVVPIEVTAQTNTFFSKVRRVKATATSYLSTSDLRPTRYVEDAVENEVPKFAEVTFQQDRHLADLDYKYAGRPGKRQFKLAKDGFDPAGAIYLLRQLPLREGAPICFDAYGIRTMWRVSGKVVGKEHVSLKLGEFDAWHLQGNAVRIDDPRWHREIHLWVSADDRRLPLAALGMMDLGVVRATLVSFSRPEGAASSKKGANSLKW